MRRLFWTLLLVWLALAGLTLLLVPFLGWPLAVGLVASIGVLFSVAMVAAAFLPFLVDWIQRGSGDGRGE